MLPSSQFHSSVSAYTRPSQKDGYPPNSPILKWMYFNVLTIIVSPGGNPVSLIGLVDDEELRVIAVTRLLGAAPGVLLAVTREKSDKIRHYSDLLRFYFYL